MFFTLSFNDKNSKCIFVDKLLIISDTCAHIISGVPLISIALPKRELIALAIPTQRAFLP